MCQYFPHFFFLFTFFLFLDISARESNQTIFFTARPENVAERLRGRLRGFAYCRGIEQVPKVKKPTQANFAQTFPRVHRGCTCKVAMQAAAGSCNSTELSGQLMSQ